MGDYYKLTQLNDYPHVVACFLKKVLRYMGEPLCTFSLYPKFKNFGDIPKERKLNYIKEICANLPTINLMTFSYLLRFFAKVVE